MVCGTARIGRGHCCTSVWKPDRRRAIGPFPGGCIDLRTEVRCVPDEACVYVVDLRVPRHDELVPMTARLNPFGDWRIAPQPPDS